MKKVIVLLVFLSAWLFGTTTTIIKEGWQLVGVPHDITDMTLFSSDNVEQLWVYDASTQSWSGYAPDDETLTKIQKSYSVISTIDKWQGVWIKSKQEWSLSQEDEGRSVTPIDTIELKAGWNLISIPLNSTLSPRIFDDNNTLVWKYSSNDWQIFEHNATTDIAPIQSIKESEGVWVKASEDRSIDISKESATLQTFESQEEMQAYIETLLEVNHYYPLYTTTDDAISLPEEVPTSAPAAVPTSSPSLDDSYTSGASNDAKEADDTTSTNLQEEGVDESDTMKSDSQYVYYLNQSSNKIEIYSFTNLVNQNKELINSIKLDGDYYKGFDSFYLYNGKLITLSISYDTTSQVVVDIYDISDITQIQKVESFILEGSLSSSRIVGNKLLIVSQFSPYADFEYPTIYLEGYEECQPDTSTPPTEIPYVTTTMETPTSTPIEEPNPVGVSVATSTLRATTVSEPYDYYYVNRCYNIYFDSEGNAYKYDYDNPILTNKYLIPQLKTSSYSGDLLSYESFYAPLKQNQTSTITTMSSFDLDTLSYIRSSAIVGNSSTVYASSSSLYTVSQEYGIFFGYYDYQERSVIYKFNIDGDLDFEAMGFISGRTLNQFSLSEHNDILRIASTEGQSWSGETTNSIFTLAQDGYDLSTVGYLGSLGKEGETIQAVRFMGDKGFVVTFLQTDPLYTLDLSDPANPSKVGELSIDGFSQYMHLVDDNRLLTIGRDADSNGVQQGIMIELFDISDFANPTLASKLTIGDSSYYSEALSNHKAFIYRASDKLFGFDYSSWEYNYYTSNDYFGIYQVKELSLQRVETLTLENPLSYCYNPKGIIYDYEEASYISYFCGDSVITQTLNTVQ